MINLEDRFQEPAGWVWGEFKRDGRKIRTGHVNAENPKATILCLQGLSEFAEKYFESAHWTLKHDYNFYTFDWMGQGGSDRYLENPHKRHSDSFEKDLEDLQEFIQNVPNDKPLILLAHSTGANLGLRYIQSHPDAFICAGLSAPLMGVAETHYLPFPLIQAIASGLNALAKESYVPGGHGWTADIRKNVGEDQFSTDPLRGAIHNAWSLHNPSLQVGSPTCGWLYDAIASIAKIKQGKNIQTHCLIGLAENDQIVDNRATQALAKTMPNAKVLTLPGAQHEILMERDNTRDQFLSEFQNLIEQSLKS